jgi:hypothetical protein
LQIKAVEKVGGVMAVKKTIVSDEVLNIIKSKIENIQFGSVVVTVQDGRVIQLETSEKTRLNR